MRGCRRVSRGRRRGVNCGAGCGTGTRHRALRATSGSDADTRPRRGPMSGYARRARPCEVVDQIRRLLEPDVRAAGTARRRPTCVAVRTRSGQVGMIRLSKPPQLQPMPNSRMPSSIASTRSLATGCSTTPNSPDAAGEIPLPQLVAARAGKRRVDHLADLGPRLQPLRDRRARLLSAARAATAACAGRAGRGSSRRATRSRPCPSTAGAAPGTSPRWRR